jgi:hypothetical protein
MNGPLRFWARYAHHVGDICQEREAYNVFSIIANCKCDGDTAGQNLYVSGVKFQESDLTKAVDRWFSEKGNYIYDDNSCNDVCGHYTQVAIKDRVYEDFVILILF